MPARTGFMVGGGVDVYSPDDASAPTTSAADQVPSRQYTGFSVPNVVMGAIGLAVLALVVHHWRG